MILLMNGLDMVFKGKRHTKSCYDIWLVSKLSCTIGWCIALSEVQLKQPGFEPEGGATIHKALKLPEVHTT